MQERAKQSLWMLLAALMFSVMGVCVKLASSHYNTGEIVFWRGLFGTLSVYLALRASGGTVRTQYLPRHILRGAIGVLALMLWFYSISQIPLAAAMTLNYTSPVWIAVIMLLTALFSNGKLPDWRLVVAIFGSFIGVILLLQPSMDSHTLKGGIVGLISGIIAAFAYMEVRHLGRLGEPEMRTVFWFSMSGTAAGAVWMALWGISAHTLYSFALLVVIGVSASIAQTAMTRAYRLGNALLTANLQYAGIIFASLWGIFLWQDHLNLLSWLGMGLIIFSGCSATFIQHRSQRPSATVEQAV